MIDQAFSTASGFILGFISCLVLIATANRRPKPPKAPAPQRRVTQCGKYVYTEEQLDDETIQLRHIQRAS